MFYAYAIFKDRLGMITDLLMGEGATEAEAMKNGDKELARAFAAGDLSTDAPDKYSHLVVIEE